MRAEQHMKPACSLPMPCNVLNVQSLDIRSAVRSCVAGAEAIMTDAGNTSIEYAYSHVVSAFVFADACLACRPKVVVIG